MAIDSTRVGRVSTQLFTERTREMPKTQILVMVLVAAAVGAAVAQAPRVA